MQLVCGVSISNDLGRVKFAIVMPFNDDTQQQQAGIAPKSFAYHRPQHTLFSSPLISKQPPSLHPFHKPQPSTSSFHLGPNGPPPSRKNNPPANQTKTTQRRHWPQEPPPLRIQRQQIQTPTKHRHTRREQPHRQRVLGCQSSRES